MNTENKNNISLKKHWELVNFCEFDKYAIKSYCAIHNVSKSMNLGDIRKIDATILPKDLDFKNLNFVYS